MLFYTRPQEIEKEKETNMKNTKSCNTYLSIDLYVWKKGTGIKSSGRIYVSCESAKLNLHMDVDYKTAKKEMAKLMLRTGKLPDVVGPDDPEMVMYTLQGFLD